MSWEDIEEKVYNNEKNMDEFVCPICGTKLVVDRCESGASVKCEECGIIERYNFGK